MGTSTKRSLAALATASLLVSGGALGASATDAPQEMRAAGAQAEVQADGGIRATDAPRAVRVGAASFSFPVTVVTDAPHELVEAGLLYDGPGAIADEAPLVAYGATEVAEEGRPTVYKPRVELYAEDLVAWGTHQWAIAGVDSDEDGLDVLTAFDTAVTEVKAHSIAGVTTTRYPSTLKIAGSVRGYHSVLDRYVPLSNRTVSIQQWTGSAWVQLIGSTTDARGNFATFDSRVAAGTPLRIVLQDAPTVWGAVSTTVRAG